MTGGRGKRGMDGWVGPAGGGIGGCACGLVAVGGFRFCRFDRDDSVSKDVLLFVGLDGFFSLFFCKGLFFLEFCKGLENFFHYSYDNMMFEWSV